jgi:predicted transcriptional regulator
MDPREIARRLGILSIEERVQIIQSLLEAGEAGLEMPDIALKTGLGAPAIVKQIEALIGAEMVNFKTRDNNKVYIVNERVLREVFDYMFTEYAPRQ